MYAAPIRRHIVIMHPIIIVTNEAIKIYPCCQNRNSNDVYKKLVDMCDEIFANWNGESKEINIKGI